MGLSCHSLEYPCSRRRADCDTRRNPDAVQPRPGQGEAVELRHPGLDFSHDFRVTWGVLGKTSVPPLYEGRAWLLGDSGHGLEIGAREVDQLAIRPVDDLRCTESTERHPNEVLTAISEVCPLSTRQRERLGGQVGVG